MSRELRILSDEEVLYVAGSSSEIVVTGSTGMMSPGDYSAWYATYGYPTDSGNTGGGGGGGTNTQNPGNPAFTQAVADAAVHGVEAIHAKLELMIHDHGGDFNLKVGNQIYSAEDLVKSFGELDRLLTVIQAADLTNGLLTGDKDAADALGFLAELAVGAALPVEAGPVALIVAEVGAGWLVETGARAIANVAEAAYETWVGHAIDTINTYVDPNSPSYQQEIQFDNTIIPQPPAAPDTSYNSTDYNAAMAAYYASNSYSYYYYG